MRPPFWLLWFVLLGCGGVVPILGGCASRSATPLWNVPSLIGQPMEVARKTLGKPQSESPVAPGTMQSQWKRDDVTLRATWKRSNGRVLAYEVISRDDSRALREGETVPLLVPGQLKENDPRYSTQWIEAADRPLFYTGVKIVPAPKNHAVVIRVSGTEALLQVAYQVSVPVGKSDNFLTIAPWEASFTLPDDATVSLAADLYKPLGKTAFQMKVEIIADGKVVASDASTGRTVRCNYEF
ncbi:MAG: hypothetical protein KY445_14465 [Armatimonadetes bacterium]|nr:hypothetical protein [Armatimonadota bacterium]